MPRQDTRRGPNGRTKSVFPAPPGRGTPRRVTATALDESTRVAPSPAGMRHPPRAEHRGLSPSARDEVRAFAEAFFSRDGTAPPKARLDWMLDDLDDLLGHAGARPRFVVRACLLTITWLVPLLLLGRLARFASLTVPERIVALEKTERSPAALAFFALRALTSLVYYEHPDAAKEIGWDQECMGVTPRRLPVLASDAEDEPAPRSDEDE